MSKVKLNNHTKAYAEVEKYSGKAIADKLPTDTDSNNAGHYYVALIKKEDNPVTKEYVSTLTLQYLDESNFIKASENVQFLGFDKIVILHSPEQVKEETKETAAAPKNESAAEMELRIRKEYDEKYANFVPTTQGYIAPGLTEAPAHQPDLTLPATENVIINDGDNVIKQQSEDSLVENTIDSDLSEKTIAQLNIYAEEFGASEAIKGLTRRDDILNSLTEWQAAQKK